MWRADVDTFDDAAPEILYDLMEKSFRFLSANLLRHTVREAV